MATKENSLATGELTSRYQTTATTFKPSPRRDMALDIRRSLPDLKDRGDVIAVDIDC